jgi:dienelactone hydrolase
MQTDISNLLGPGKQEEVMVGSWRLPGTLYLPENPFSLVIFAHGSGSSRFSARNRQVANALARRGMAALLFDLLHPEEEEAQGRAKVFDIPFLAERVVDAIAWADRRWAAETMPVGLFGASTGAGAALVAAAHLPKRIGAVVSRGGRPDLAGDALDDVQAPTLLIVGGADRQVLELNRAAELRLKGITALKVVPGATHLFSEPGAMEDVVACAFRGSWALISRDGGQRIQAMVGRVSLTDVGY